MKFLNILLAIFFTKEIEKGREPKSAIDSSRAELTLLLYIFMLLLLVVLKNGLSFSGLTLPNDNILASLLLCLPTFYIIYNYCWDIDEINAYLEDSDNQTFVNSYKRWTFLFYVIAFVIIIWFSNLNWIL